MLGLYSTGIGFKNLIDDVSNDTHTYYIKWSNLHVSNIHGNFIFIQIYLASQRDNIIKNLKEI